MNFNFKQTSIDDIRNIIIESIEESVNDSDIIESINLTFARIDNKLKEFFNEQA